MAYDWRAIVQAASVATAFLTVAVVPRAIAQPTQAGSDTELPSVMLIVDGSGSMWGKLGADTKSYAVRDALKQRLPGVAARIGLSTFGYRRTGDCSDAHVVAEIGENDPERYAPFIEKFNPRGKGPVAEGLKVAAEHMSTRRGRRSLILVADNADNCRGDPCALAGELKTKGLVAHVIALGVPDEELPRLACIATATGGQTFRAANATEVDRALGEALARAAGPATRRSAVAMQAAPAVESKRNAEALPAAPGLKLVALMKSGGQSIGAGLRWRVTDTTQKVVHEGTEASPWVELVPGTYTVVVHFGLASATRQVTVSGTAPTREQIALDAGVIRVSSRAATAARAADRAFYTLYQVNRDSRQAPRAVALSSDDAPVYNVPAGAYHLAVQQGLARQERAITIEPGAIVDVDLPLYLGEVRLSAVSAKGGKPLTEMFFAVLEDDPDAPGGQREVVRSGASEPRFSLPAGSYHVLARYGATEVRERITVAPGASQLHALVLGAGELAYAATLAGGSMDRNLVSFRVLRIEKDPTGASAGEVAVVSAASGVLSLPAGRYVVESRYGPINARVRREIEIRPGQRQEISAQHAAGQVELRLVQPGREGALSGVFWELEDEAGRILWTTGDPTPQLVLQAGRYRVRGEHSIGTGAAPLSVTSGMRGIVEIPLK
jgi:Ca-activated chloride channel family protein